MKSLLLIVPYCALALVISGCGKVARQSPGTAAVSCTSYAYIGCIFDSGGNRFAEIDTVQKSYLNPDQSKQHDRVPQPVGHGIPTYGNRGGRFDRWLIAQDASFRMQTLTNDSSGNFSFNQKVEYTTIRNLFAKDAQSRFRSIPFKIIHSDSIISSICEEYVQ